MSTVVFRRSLVLFASILAVAACSSSGVKKGGGGANANTAKTSNQKTGSSATSGKSSGSSKGSSVDGVACDGAASGVGLCADDSTLVFCDGESWWGVSCPAIVGSGYCGYDDANATVDCYAP